MLIPATRTGTLTPAERHRAGVPPKPDSIAARRLRLPRRGGRHARLPVPGQADRLRVQPPRPGRHVFATRSAGDGQAHYQARRLDVRFRSPYARLRGL